MAKEHIEWLDKYVLGVQEIDLQHHYFVDLINRFLDEMGEADEAYTERLIDELDAYAKFHFISEENLMYKAGYPGLDEHSRHHFDLIQTLNVKQTLFSQGEVSAEEITDFLRTWFIHHSMQEDRRFTDYLTGK